ncbi:MAG: CDP-glycerol glycerophosphotransferase family protein [Akkermansia sp.]|nr:CDP-glycerol glycerophosphotransferase family protein [Akkermansia sp.]
MKLFGTIKDKKGKRIYVSGAKVYEEREKDNVRKKYLFGICVGKKNLKVTRHDSNANGRMESILDRIEWKSKLYAAEQKILTLGLLNKDMPQEKRYVLCFDALMSPHPEAIDAWTLFQYLQEKGIPSKYVLRWQNPLFQKLKDANKLKDIIPVANELQLLTDYADIIAQSRLIMCSFGFDLSRILRQLPFAKYIFIEHGVILINEWAAHYYNDKSFDAHVVPTIKTKELYDRLGYDESRMICSGIPRWDLLPPAQKHKETRKIFIFFTMRAAFWEDKSLRPEYVARIQTFIDKVNEILLNRNDVQVYLAPHHCLMYQDSNFKASIFKNVNIVPTTNISTMVKDADLCVTDFSSISFDFMYRNVPVIYYGFDTDLNYSHPRDKTKIAADVIDKLLYNGCRDLNTAIERVKYYVDHNFELETELVNKNNEIFWQRGGNCERLMKMADTLS